MVRRLVVGIVMACALVLAGAMDHPAEAAKKKKAKVRPASTVAESALVVDAASGEILLSENVDAPRYPASLTKMMTAYMVFDALAKKRLTLTQSLPVSAHAASMTPSKLGLLAGEQIRVEDALLGIVTKSANDAAVVLGEAIGGSEQGFARLMTQKARALGMSRTTFQNASGLPDPDQQTTARDMATLGLALLRDFPGYYRYFSTETFYYGDAAHRNHNRMLETYDGVDGIKTGFISASGFNIVVTAQRDGRRLIAVVFGGRSASLRNARAAVLLDSGFERAGPGDGRTVIASAVAPSTRDGVSGHPDRDAMMLAAYSAGETEAESRTQGDRSPARAAKVPAVKPVAVAPAAPVKPATAPTEGAQRLRGWMVQVGAYESQASAKDGLKRAATGASRLLQNKPTSVVAFRQGNKTLYRARVGNLSRIDAMQACRQLSHKQMPCMMLPPDASTAQAEERRRG
jgi:D-alanyl-D-alanine carboxypeptidase